ncbi:hypothetical protein BG000_003913 [Podila horticola]|nr:hypothetical protein BG000_003913 [Podila horticola]
MTPEYHHVNIPESPVESKPHLPLLPKNEAATPPPTCTRPTLRKPWMILSLPLAVAMVFTAGMCCLSTAEIKSALQSLEHLTMASASWPIMPPTFEEQMDPQQQLQQQPSPFSVQHSSNSIVPKEGTRSTLFVEDGCGDEDEDEYDDDDEEEDEEGKEENDEPIEQFQALEIITVEEGNVVEVVVVEEEPFSVQDLVQRTTANALVSSPVTLSRRRDQDDDQEDDEGDDEDEDRQDHFPSSMNDDDDDDDDHDDNTSAQDEEEQPKEVKKDDKTSTSPLGDPKDKDHPNSNHHSQHQDQNTNLGGTGGNGPILLCSSRVCLPSLRDSILAKLSVQIRHVMDHLRSRQVLVQRMDTTAPLTKDLLISSQSDLVQQLEEQINKDLKDWVMGRKRSSAPAGGDNKSRKNLHMPSANDASENHPNRESEADAIDQIDDISVEAVAVFLGGEEEEFAEEVSTFGVSTTTGEENETEPEFQMVGLDLEDDDDDDEDHEYDTVTRKKPSNSKKTSSSSSSHLQRRASSAHREYFLSADKLLMQQEWSRWIAHWVHHAKLLVLSHTLATRTLNNMNQLAITDDNVPMTDQRHWSWNLDKALATVMVASEMLCGGLADPKDAQQFLQALSMPVGSSSSSSPSSSSSSSATPKIMTLTGDLEEILKKTATTTA